MGVSLRLDPPKQLYIYMYLDRWSASARLPVKLALKDGTLKKGQTQINMQNHDGQRKYLSISFWVVLVVPSGFLAIWFAHTGLLFILGSPCSCGFQGQRDNRQLRGPRKKTSRPHGEVWP